MNHAIADGGSFCHFLKSWSEISAGAKTITRQPMTERPLIHKEVGQIRFVASGKDLDRTLPPPFKVRMFRFTSKAVARVKAKTNERLKLESGEISSLQAITALLWRSTMRAKNFPDKAITICVMAVGCRSRLEPPLPEEYFGNCLHPLMVQAKVGELLADDLSWAAQALHSEVAAQTADVIRERVKAWAKMPFTYGNSRPVSNVVVVGMSPRYELYGIDFGWGTGHSVIGGPGSKFDGKIEAFAGKCGKGSIDLQVCLAPQYLSALESDRELLDALNAA